MLKKKIKFVDYNDVEQEVEFHFNINKLELARLLAEYGDIQEYLARIMEAKDANAIVAFVEKVVLMSYGVKMPDGTFVKSDDLKEKFANSAAYVELIFDIGQNEETAVEFFKHVFPKEAQKPPSN